LTIEGEDQVQLKVSVVEMERTVAKQLGINLSLQGTIGSIVTSSAIADAALSATFDKAGSDFSATLTALEEEGLARKLAEPTLTAISGETANFLAGGEFPVPTDYDSEKNKITYTFKEYGVSLGFTPVTLSEGRISLKVKTEVSELSDDGAVTIAGVSIKSLKVRRAESTLELPSGGTLALGGLLQDDVTQTLSGTPGLKDLPVLGALFRSRDYQRKQTELVILVTPYIVRPTARSAMARPDDGYEPAGDAETVLLGRLNKVYGKAGTPAPKGRYGGQYGYIYD
jgi:pilus assembly protein CpaC